MLLVGDIGGTKTELALISPERGPQAPLAEAKYASTEYPDLATPARDFLARQHAQVESAVFGVAGPVVRGAATITNLPWKLDEAELARALQVDSVRLLNDLQATAYAVLFLEPADVHTLQAGQPAAQGAIGVIAPGTGLGEAYLTWGAGRYHPHACEGGHTDFAPTNAHEIALLEYLQPRIDHVSYERVCSGIGIPNLYGFLKESGYAEEPAWLTEALAQAGDPTPVIVNAAQDTARPAELACEVLRMFVEILGAEAGNLALKVLATGGVYLAGGIPPRILPALGEPRFLEAFTRKGRLSRLLADMPVHVILSSRAALLGAAAYGLEYEAGTEVGG